MNETRKRAISPGLDGPLQKKRNVSTSEEPKPITGVVVDNDEEQAGISSEKLENFRKEAIFRRMKHYAREYEQAKSKIQELEQRINHDQTTVAAVDASWNQIVEHAKTLIPGGLPSIPEAELEIYNVAFNLPTESEDLPDGSKVYYERLRKTSAATQRLLSALIQMVPNAATPAVADLQKQLTRHVAEASAHRAENRMLRSKLSDVSERLEASRLEVATLENKVERAKSQTIVAMELTNSAAKSEDKPQNVKQEQVPLPNGHFSSLNGASPLKPIASTDDASQEVLEIRDRQIADLEKELSTMTSELSKAQLELSNLSETTVKETVAYKALFNQLTELKTSSDEASEKARKLEVEVEQLKTSRTEYQTSVEVASKHKVDELSQKILKLSNDNTRLRGARDAANNEIQVLKAKEAKAVVKELTNVNKFQSERINSLVKENQRLRASLAVEAGEVDLYAFIANDTQHDTTYVKHLQAQLKESEARNASLQASLKGNPDVAKQTQATADARQACAKLQEKLDQYERVYGSTSNSGTNLVERLAEKEAIMRQMRIMKRQEDERLLNQSTVVDDLCRQVEDLMNMKDKHIADLTALEEKYKKASVEKTKADTKYFATMKAKDTLEAVKTTLEGTLDKQSKRIQRLLDLEQALRQQIQSLERLEATGKNDIAAGQIHLSKLKADMELEHAKSEALAKEISELHHQLEQRTKDNEERRHALRASQEESVKLKKQLAKAEYKSQHVASSSDAPNDVVKQNENLLKVLRCSTCNNDFRSHVILKCMHTFCKGCIDARINSRQRKCPGCQIPFGVSDVQQVYFQ